jgi:hypothetical protein
MAKVEVILDADIAWFVETRKVGIMLVLVRLDDATGCEGSCAAV